MLQALPVQLVGVMRPETSASQDHQGLPGPRGNVGSTGAGGFTSARGPAVVLVA